MDLLQNLFEVNPLLKTNGGGGGGEEINQSSVCIAETVL